MARTSGRRVLLRVGGAGRVPRRYRGRDCVAWLVELGFFDRTPNMLDSPAQRFRAEVQASGRDGGRTISLHSLRRDGVRLLGKLAAVDGEMMHFANDFRLNMENADRFSRTFQQGVDALLETEGIDAPPPTAEELEGEPPDGAWSVRHVPSIDLRAQNVTAVVWATGFSYDFSWINFPVCDGMGYPVTDRGGDRRARALLHGSQLDGEAQVGAAVRGGRRCAARRRPYRGVPRRPPIDRGAAGGAGRSERCRMPPHRPRGRPAGPPGCAARASVRGRSIPDHRRSRPIR